MNGLLPAMIAAGFGFEGSVPELSVCEQEIPKSMD